MSAETQNGHISRTTPLADLPELMTPDEVRAFLGVGRGTVYELLRRSELKSVKLGRLLRVPKSALAELLARAQARTTERMMP